MADMMDGLKSTGAAVAEKFMGMKNVLFIIGGAVVAVIVLALVLSILFGSTVKGAVKDYIDLAYTFDADTLSDAIPDEAWGTIAEKYTLSEREYEAFLERYEDDLLDLKYCDDLGDDIDYASVDIISEVEMGTVELELLREALKTSYGIPKKEIDDAYLVTVEFVIEGEMDENTYSVQLVVYEMGSTYYVAQSLYALDVTTLDDSFSHDYSYYSLADLIAREKKDYDSFIERMNDWTANN